ncbi:LamG-like jellyroll fold domain-containing protein [Natronoglycomyces albus]|uniref:Laminin G domain-containing protein n=1 Tax=Natronoglycomyces albus TaxID=2811108 RepID=A0A895XWM8_9ACTN|nr:LamG-like jellyroll fold domain-containing protein [Natronoglycomyces albus]QSB06038.1 laminin G domain-containing protein [Natronoglycomyces albus]
MTATSPEGGSLALRWPDSLPQPVVEGSSATYADVYPDVDLVVTAKPDGFFYVLVVHTPEAASLPELANVEVGVESVELDVSQEPETNVVVARDDEGDVAFESGQALMWDSSSIEHESKTVEAEGLLGAFVDVTDGTDPMGADQIAPGRVSEMAMSLSEETLSVVPDADLLSDSEAVYPIYIDPPFRGARMGWTNVFREQPNSSPSWWNDGGMRVGYQGWECSGDPTCGRWRSVVRFNTEGIRNKQIISASVKVRQTHSGNCSGTTPLRIWQVHAIDSSSTWNSVSWQHGSSLQTRDVGSSNSNCGGSNRVVNFNGSGVRQQVQRHASHPYNTISFGFRSGSEGDRMQYRRLGVNSSYPRLDVEYNSYPTRPTRQNTHGRGCASSSPGPWINTRSPSLRGRPHDPDGRVGYQIRVYPPNSTSSIRSYTSASRTLATGVDRSWNVSSDLSDGNYRWRMRSRDNYTGSNNQWSNWASFCYFRVDTTPPTAPDITKDGHEFLVPEHANVALNVESSDEGSGVAAFEYSWNSDTYDQSVTSSGMAQITLHRVPAGRHTVYVRALDHAGNYSNSQSYSFYAGRFGTATPTGAWQIDGDWWDQTGNGHHVSPLSEAGVEFTEDRHGRVDSAATFDGEACAGTASEVVRTDAAYSLAMWARVDDLDTDQVFLSQAGANRSEFTLGYDSHSQRWNFRLAEADVSDPATFAQVSSSQPVQAGRWYHVMVTVDPEVEYLRLHIDGEFDSDADYNFENWRAPVGQRGGVGIGCALHAGADGPSMSDFVTGAIDQVVIWQGVASDRLFDEAAVEVPGSLQAVRWEFRDSGQDSSGFGRDVDIPDQATVGADPFERPRGSMELSGDSCASYPEPTVVTDRSFVISAWVRPDDLDSNATAVSIAGDDNTAARLRYLSEEGQFQFAMLSADAPSGAGADWITVLGDTEIEAKRWYHLTGVYDRLNGHIRLYVDGEAQGSREASADFWIAGGPTLVGCAGRESDSHRWEHWSGGIHDVQLWSGSDVRFAEVMGATPVELQAWWALDGGGEDWTDNGRHLQVEGDHEWVDGWDATPGGAIRFERDGAACVEYADFAPSSSFTFTTWVRLDQISFSSGNSGPGTVVQYTDGDEASFHLWHGGMLPYWTWSIDTVNGPNNGSHPADRAGIDEEWIFLAVASDHQDGARFFINGQHVATFDTPKLPMEGSLCIGGGVGDYGMPLQGELDDVIVWSGVVPDQTIMNMYDPNLVVN